MKISIQSSITSFLTPSFNTITLPIDLISIMYPEYDNHITTLALDKLHNNNKTSPTKEQTTKQNYLKKKTTSNSTRHNDTTENNQHEQNNQTNSGTHRSKNLKMNKQNSKHSRRTLPQTISFRRLRLVGVKDNQEERQQRKEMKFHLYQITLFYTSKSTRE